MGDGQKQSRETHWEAPAKHQDPKERARRWEDYLEQGLHETERLIKCWLWLLGVPTLANSWDCGPFLGNPRGACWEQVGRRMRLRTCGASQGRCLEGTWPWGTWGHNLKTETWDLNSRNRWDPARRVFMTKRARSENVHEGYFRG